jgi:plastocyanin
MATRHLRPARRAALLVAVGSGLLLAACGDEDATGSSPTVTTAAPGADVPVTEIAVTAGGAAGEMTFTTDLTTVEAGRVRVDLTNEGRVDHQAMLLRMDDGVDFAGLLAAGAEGADAFLDLVSGYGGPNGAGPGGGTSSSVQDLDPGDYLLACLIPDAAGVPHVAQGMFREFTVTEPGGGTDAIDAAPLPGDGEIGLVDFGFTGDTELAAGTTVTVRNDGGQDHELAAYAIAGDATADDVARALEDPSSGPPPYDPDGAGLGLVRPGGTAAFTLPDRPGRYALVCFVPDVRGDLAPHYTKGMLAEIELT